MSKIGRWSTAAGSNNTAAPDGWPEGMLPSQVNNCAREMMASIRTAFEDLQYVDQDFTPTFITASSFSVPGNQTSAVHIGRRLKCFDATAGVQQVIYGTVVSVSFTAVTTIHIEADAGSLTSSLSSFGISVIANTPNNALPRNLVLTVSSVTVLGGMSISGSLAASSLAISGNASISGNMSIAGNLSVSGSCVALNAAKAFVTWSGGATTIIAGYNTASLSISTGPSGFLIYRVNFTNALSSVNYIPLATFPNTLNFGGGKRWDTSATTNYLKITFSDTGVAWTPNKINLVIFG